jgi:hypothetical protein
VRAAPGALAQALMLLSGGLDSASAMAWAIAESYNMLGAWTKAGHRARQRLPGPSALVSDTPYSPHSSRKRRMAGSPRASPRASRAV